MAEALATSHSLWDRYWEEIDPPIVSSTDNQSEDGVRSSLLILPARDQLKDALPLAFSSASYRVTSVAVPVDRILNNAEAFANLETLEKHIVDVLSEFSAVLRRTLQTGRFAEIVCAFSADAFELDAVVQKTVSTSVAVRFNVVASYISRVSLFLLSELQRQSESRDRPPARLWWLTRGANVVDGEEVAQLAPAQAAYQALGTGFSRIANGELRDIRSISVDFEPNSHFLREQCAALVNYAKGSRPLSFHAHSRVAELEVALREAGTKWWALRLRTSGLVDRANVAEQFICRSDGVYVLTGGVGGLGFEVAQWLVRHAGAKRVLLAGRTAPSAALASTMASLGAETGVTLEFVKCDISQPKDVAHLLEQIGAMKGFSLRGIFHLAGVLHPLALAKTTWTEMHTAMAGKVLGALNVLEALDLFPALAQSLELFVTFSSMSSLLFTPNSTAYISANVVLDRVAWCRRAGVSLNLNWCPWTGAGMAVDSFHAFWEQRGLGSIALPQGVSLLARLLARRQSAQGLLVQPADWARYARALGHTPPLVRTVLVAQLNADKPTEEETSSVASKEAALEPLAIVGLACRLPGGANSAEQFWELLARGEDAIKPIPASRFNMRDHFAAGATQPHKAYTQEAALLEPEAQAYAFDAPFFGVSPREAVYMDPQLRLLLHVTAEALQDANIPMQQLRESLTGVFVAASNFDYTRTIHETQEDLRDHFAPLGASASMLAGRVSFWLQSFGPSVVIDGSCAGSLVALHAACQSVRAGDCPLAVVGGVNLDLRPEWWISYSQLHMMAPDGRCKAFDARGDGFGRGEGCGVVLIKKLSDAQRDGDRVHALILGTSSMHVGRPEQGGITMPNSKAQALLMQRALRTSGLAPSQVSLVEAHGTGTQAGDPRELGAIEQIYGTTRRSEPLWLGSVKSAIGHLEPAAGMAGLLKCVLALRHRALPPQVQYRTHNSKLPLLEQIPAVLPLHLTPWPAPRSGEPRRAAINSFGFNGSMGHVIVQEAPPAPQHQQQKPRNEAALLPLSAVSHASLIELCKCFSNELQWHPEGWYDMCASAARYRDHYSRRVALIANSAAEMAALLDDVVQGSASPKVFTSEAAHGGSSSGSSGVALLFTGQGSQYYNMGRELYRTQPTFRRWMDEVDALTRPHVGGRSLVSCLYPTEPLVKGAAFEKDHPDLVQLGLFAVEYSMAQLWLAAGVQPQCLMGHSLGEYVAACVAGAMDLATALELVAARAAIMATLPKTGVMASINGASPEVIAQAMTETQLTAAQVSIAAVNGPTLCVVSGSEPDVSRLLEAPALTKARKQLLRVSSAFHSHLVEPILAQFEAVVQKLQPRMRAPRLPVVCNLHGRVASGTDLCSPQYWSQHMRQSVQFLAGARTLYSLGVRTFVEVGPHPVLTQLAAGCLDALQSAQCLWLSSLKRPATPEAPAEDMTHLWTVAASLYAHGTQLEWAALYPEGSFARTTLPLYPWDMKHYDLAQQQQQSPPPRASSRARAAVVGEPFEEEPQHQQQPSATSVVAAPSSGNSGVDARAAIRRILGELLGVSDVDDQTPLQQLGLDSLLAMQFSTQLSRVLGKPVPATLAISLRTVAAIADFVAPAATTTATSPTSVSSSSSSSSSQPGPSGATTASKDVAGLIENLLRRLLGLAATAPVSHSVPFQELGMDSLIAIELMNQLSRALGRPLPATLATSLRTIDALAAHLGGVPGSAVATVSSTTAAAAAVPATAVTVKKVTFGARISWQPTTVPLDAPCIIVGSGGHTRTLIGALEGAKRPILGIYTNQSDRVGQAILGVPIKGTLSDVPPGVPVNIAIGAWKMRREWVAMFAGRNPFATIVHPSAQICHSSVAIGEGSYVGVGVVLEAEVTIGAHTILSANTAVGHNSTVGSFVLTGGGCTVAGGGYVGDDCELGVNASIAPKCGIGNRVVVGAGSAVMTKVPDAPGSDSTLLVIGVPAVSDGL